MYINEYFKTPVWMEEKPEFVKSLNKASDKYIKAAKKMPDSKKYLKAQENAMQWKNGLWRGKFDMPEEWRKKNK